MMKRTITISGIQCEMKSSAAIPRMYRLKFERDIFVDMQKIAKQIEVQNKLKEELRKQAEENGEEFDESKFESGLPVESLEIFENIAFLMHKHGDPSQPKEIDEWLDQFDMFDIYKVFPEILKMWNIENKQMSTPKKRTGK